MSWSFQLQSINRSFDRIALWYKEFMHRTELCFREVHERLIYLEQRQASSQGPSDEQVERVLRKILAERFSSTGTQNTDHTTATRDGEYFVEDRKGLGFPKPIMIDPATLNIDPESIPSAAYVETFSLLESQLGDFPHTKLDPYCDGDDKDDDEAQSKANADVKAERSSNSV